MQPAVDLNKSPAGFFWPNFRLKKQNPQCLNGLRVLFLM
jgi:hypothetical protein